MINPTPRPPALPRWLLTVSIGLGLGSIAYADEPPPFVPWLRDVQAAPAKPDQRDLGRMEPLLKGDAGAEITTRAAWEKRRAALRDPWMTFLGPMPQDRPAVTLERLSETRVDGAVRQLVKYEGEPGMFVEGYLLRPDGDAAKRLAGKDGRLPGLVALHQTTQATIDEIAGVSGPEQMHLGLKLCRRGFVVFCPRCFLWEGTNDIVKATEAFLKRRPGTRGMHKMLYDAQRGVDVLASLPDVDPERLGSVGHSLGAKEVLYLAAFDERVKASVASEGGVGFPFTNWHSPWYLGPAIREKEFARNHHELLALTAPRALLVLGGESGPGAADGARTWPFLDAALPVYRLYGPNPKLGLLNHGKGHSIPPDAFEKTAEWLEAGTR